MFQDANRYNAGTKSQLVTEQQSRQLRLELPPTFGESVTVSIAKTFSPQWELAE